MEEQINELSKLIQERLSGCIGDPLTPEKYNELKQEILDHLPIIKYEIEIVKEKCTDDKMVFNIKPYQEYYLIDFVLD